MSNEPEITLTDGSPVTEDHRELDPTTGQQKGYVVLSDTERAKGFVRPLRYQYTHLGKSQIRETPDGAVSSSPLRLGGCGETTKMGVAIAETYARDPSFYTGTFCVGCKKHLPLDEFVWAGTNDQVGS